MKFSCGITLYNSSLEELEKMLKYDKVFERVYLYDNTENCEKRLVNKNFFLDKTKFVYTTNKGNNGLSIAYNVMCKNAIYENCDFICILDQDSYISCETIQNIIERIKNDNRKNVGIYAPIIKYNHKNSLRNDKQNTESEVDWVISSGSFVNLKAFKATGGFDEKYFIDRLDYDFCMRVKQSGYIILRFGDIVLNQNLGDTKKLIWSNISQHNPIRHYYMFRNRLYFYLKKMPKKFLVIPKVFLLSVKHLIQVCLFEDNKLEKFKMIYRGWGDFKNEKMGKFRP